MSCMNVYIGGRGTGKTRQAIVASALTGGIIVAPSEAMAKYIQEQAMCIGLDIPKPISVRRFIEIKAENKDYGKTYIFDEAQMILSSLGVLTATFGTPSCTICHLNKKETESPKNFSNEENEKENASLLRPCRVDGIDGYFHRWIERERGFYTAAVSLSRERMKKLKGMIEASPAIVSDYVQYHKTGMDICALFEARNGSIHIVPAEKVVFLDHMHEVESLKNEEDI